MSAWAARSRSTVAGALPRLAAVPVALILAAVLLWLVDAPPLETLELLVDGSLGSQQRFGDTLMVWVPLALASASLVVTFRAGLWNIGVEGQIILGAIATSWVAREVAAPSPVLLTLMILAGAIGGLAWGALVGVLRVRGNVNEIFGGLGLDFVATGLVIYLVIGPWKRAGIASTGGTEPFPDAAWFPTIAGLRVSPLAVAIAILALIAVALLLRGTQFGLRLRAVGQNAAAAGRLGIPTARYLVYAFLLGGALAGLAGTVQAAALQHKLVPSISGGYGFLAILVVLLANFRATWAGVISFVFAMIAVGSVQWQLKLDLHSSLGGVFEGMLVLVTLLIGGWQVRRARMRAAEGAP
ncbi:MAG: ABC transporter permease [Dehalococcoidia bacterium]